MAAVNKSWEPTDLHCQSEILLKRGKQKGCLSELLSLFPSPIEALTGNTNLRVPNYYELQLGKEAMVFDEQLGSACTFTFAP